MQWTLPDVDRYFAPLLTERGFEIEKLDAALAHVTTWDVAVDGGAHIGTWAIEMSKRFARVVAFEPAEDTFSCLCRNVARTGAGNISLVRAGLGACSERMAIVDDCDRPGNTGARFLVLGAGVDVVTLDSYSLENVGFVKLDVEGFEWFALVGAEQTIKRCRPVVMIEDKHFERRYGLQQGAAAALLMEWGMVQIARIRNDRVFGW